MLSRHASLIAAILIVGFIPKLHAQEVYACLDGSAASGSSADGSGTQACDAPLNALPLTLGSGAVVSVCRGGTQPSGATAYQCTANGGALVWAQVGSFLSGDLVVLDDAGLDMSPASSVTFGVSSAGGGGASSFDPSTLDPGSLTAYFSWGWFIVALGWVVGKGVGLLVEFVKSL